MCRGLTEVPGVLPPPTGMHLKGKPQLSGVERTPDTNMAFDDLILPAHFQAVSLHFFK